MARAEKLSLKFDVVLPEMTAADRWAFVEFIQKDFKKYVEAIGDVQFNYTPNEFWRAVKKFDVRVTGTVLPVAEEPEPIQLEAFDSLETSDESE